jgi:hypothetical protein
LLFLSTINIKEDITVVQDDLNFVFPELISYKTKNEIYIILKGAKYCEIYSVELDMKLFYFKYIKQFQTLSFNLNNFNFISFSIREYIGSFYITKYDEILKTISIFIFGDKNNDNYQETETKFKIIDDLNLPEDETLIRIGTSIISSYLLGIMIVTNKKVYVFFTHYPICDQSPINKIFNLKSNEAVYLSTNDLIPSSLENYIYSNSIVDKISLDNSKFSKIYFKVLPHYSEILDVSYNHEDKSEIFLLAKNQIQNLELSYNLYYEDIDLSNFNKFFSPSCSLYINICHESCQSCTEFSTDDTNPKCIECRIPYFYPVMGIPSICKSKDEIPFQNYYLDEIQGVFKQCDDSCSYCSGPSDKDCLKCSLPSDYLSSLNLKHLNINSKDFESSNCIPCNVLSNYFYSSLNFGDNSVKVCLDNSFLQCPNEFPYLLNYHCYQNCKDSGTDKIFGNSLIRECQNFCPNNKYLKNDNTCVDNCPEGYYEYINEHYCIEKCDIPLYHVKQEKINDNSLHNYFELSCRDLCPSESLPYYFIDNDHHKFCLSN